MTAQEQKLTAPQARMLKSVASASEQWDGLAPHGAADWRVIRSLVKLKLVHFVDFGQCADGCDRAGDCPHDVQIYVLSDEGQRVLEAQECAL